MATLPTFAAIKGHLTMSYESSVALKEGTLNASAAGTKYSTLEETAPGQAVQNGCA